MEIYQAFLSNVPSVRVVGDIDHGASRAFHDAVQAALDQDGGRLLLDLRACAYLDSGGLGVIMTAFEKLRGRGWVGVIGPDPNVRKLLDLVGLVGDESFVVFGSEEEVAKLIAAQTSDDYSGSFEL